MKYIKNCIRDKFATLNINVHKFNYINIILIIVACIISSVALLKDNYQTVIASKLIGLAIIPFISLCIMIIAGTTEEILHSSGSCISFITLCLFISGIIGFINSLMTSDEVISAEMQSRAEFKYENVMLELFMSGVAGVGMYYAIMKTSTIALIGLVLAISIIPALCNAGLFWGMSGYLMLEGQNTNNANNLMNEQEKIEKNNKINKYIDSGMRSFTIFASNITGMFLGFMVAYIASCIF